MKDTDGGTQSGPNGTVNDQINNNDANIDGRYGNIDGTARTSSSTESLAPTGGIATGTKPADDVLTQNA